MLFKNIKMSSTSELKNDSSKINKKKYQHIKISSKNSSIFNNAENLNNDNNHKAGKTSFNGCFNFEDFPELKGPRKFSSEFKNFSQINHKWPPAVNSYEKTSRERSTLSLNNYSQIIGTNNKSVWFSAAHPKSKLEVQNEKATSSGQSSYKNIQNNQNSENITASVLPPLNHNDRSNNNNITAKKFHNNVKKETGDIIKVNQSVHKEVDNVAGISKEKKLASSKVSIKPQRNPNKKKRTDPIVINFQDILIKNKTQIKAKQHNSVKSNIQRFKNKEFLAGNLLDSSNPKRSRGKHREIKKKKLSHIKMAIIKERIIKQKLKEKQIKDPSLSNECFNLIDSIDFQKEIKTYLSELSQKKLKITENSCKKLNEDKSKNESIVQKQENIESESMEKADNVKDSRISTNSTGEVKFSAKFREYCDNIITPSLNAAVDVLIKEIIKLQDKLFFRDPVKAKAKKRHVSGIREVKKYLILKKVKMVIIAPNLEKLQMEGSVFDAVNQLISLAESQNVPYGFALDRYKLGKCTKKNVPISAFAILNYEGTETLYQNALHELLEAKKQFSELKGIKKEEKADDINSNIISSLISAFRSDLQVSSSESLD